MPTDTRTVELSASVFEIARRTASLDNVDVTTLLESLVRRHAEDIDAFEGNSASMPRFSLDHYKPQRDPDETDEEFENRLSLFR